MWDVFMHWLIADFISLSFSWMLPNQLWWVEGSRRLPPQGCHLSLLPLHKGPLQEQENGLVPPEIQTCFICVKPTAQPRAYLPSLTMYWIIYVVYLSTTRIDLLLDFWVTWYSSKDTWDISEKNFTQVEQKILGKRNVF